MDRRRCGVRPHWAFQRPKSVTPPQVDNAPWARNPIDQFVLQRLQQHGVAPSEAADPHALARRVSLDLTGLPPTPSEVEAFLKDPSDAGYEHWVDQLLASPRYGERWGRRWMDLARYADTNGYEKDRTRSIWPWRDWVIRSLNADMPFDQFTLEQLAGTSCPTPRETSASPPVSTGTPCSMKRAGSIRSSSVSMP